MALGLAEPSKDVEELASKLAALFGEPTEAEQQLPSAEVPAEGLSRQELEREFHFALVDLYRRSATEAGVELSRPFRARPAVSPRSARPCRGRW